MTDERTCRTCWHWGVIEPGQGLCGHPDTGGAVHGADDTCCNHLAIVGRGGYWQPPAQDTLTIMAERDKLQARVAELDAELENERRRVAELSRDNWNLHEALSVAEAEMQPTEVCPACNGDVPWGKPGICYLCGNMGVVTKERLLRIDAFRQCEAANKRIAELETAVATLEDKCDEYAAALNDRAELCDRLRAYCRRDRRAVGVLGEELETRFGICACDVQDGWEQHRGGSVVGACWAAWARERAREDAAKTGTTQKGNG